jgi:transposase
MRMMNYTGLGVHKKTINYCVKDASGRIQRGRQDRVKPDASWIVWMKTLPQPWTVAMEATIFSAPDTAPSGATRFGWYRTV